jgi:hypothetical protein
MFNFFYILGVVVVFWYLFQDSEEMYWGAEDFVFFGVIALLWPAIMALLGAGYIYLGLASNDKSK